MLNVGGLLGGVLIKLKMGKAEDATAAKSTDEEGEIEQPQAPSKNQDSNDTSEEIAEDVESLRSVIKLDENGSDEEVKEKTDGVGDLVKETDSNAPTSSRESLEQKRVLLQRIKDFDLQIKKNQQDINDASDKINSISKDLDDLVSLYEIVSEQMNPFVGLSKVTKKRLESFENIHKELSILKEKVSTIESGGNFDFDKMVEPEPGTIEEEQTDPSLNPAYETVESKEEIDPETIEEEQLEPSLNHSHEAMQNKSDSGIDSLYDFDLTDDEINQILEMSFSQIPSENQVDRVIDEYIESLKTR